MKLNSGVITANSSSSTSISGSASAAGLDHISSGEELTKRWQEVGRRLLLRFKGVSNLAANMGKPAAAVKRKSLMAEFERAACDDDLENVELKRRSKPKIS